MGASYHITGAEDAPAAGATENPEDPAHLLEPQHWLDLPRPDDTDSTLGDDAASSTASISSSILHYRTVNGRTYHSDRGKNHYWGANDDLQQNTLDISHHAYTIALEGKLYLAPLPDKIDKALDIGTGTGIWAIDFADERPDTQVIGTDISPIQPTWIPPNVSFQVDDFSQEWTFAENSFDYVHLRWLVGSVEDWPALFKEAYRVLKPGGWIETYDFDGQARSDDGTVTNKTAIGQWGTIFQEGARRLGSRADISPVTHGLQVKALKEAGFPDIQEKSLRIPMSEWPSDPVLKEAGQFFRVALANDIEGLMGYMGTQLGWTKEQITVYAAHMRKEMREQKVHGYWRGLVAYAQKPLDAKKADE